MVDTRLDILFVSEHALWPLDQGFRIHGWQMARQCSVLGARVAVATIQPTPADAPAMMKSLSEPWPDPQRGVTAELEAAWSGWRHWPKRRLARYQGRDLPAFAGIRTLARRLRPRVIVALGQHGPMLLQCLPPDVPTQRIWYAADEMVYFQLSCLRRDPLRDWPNRLAHLALYLGLEQTFARGLDGAIGVSPLDTALLRRFVGVRRAITLRNGVDMEYFHAAHAGTPLDPYRLIFWGRLDFEPNIDAVCWFAREVWPTLKARQPRATWRIVGRNAGPRVQALGRQAGIEVLGAVADIRPHACGAGITILPMRCGGGIKNKLLEAAAMGRTIVASPKAVQGLNYDDTREPFALCRDASQWITTISRLWTDRAMAQRLAHHAQQWVRREHDWRQAAGDLLQWLAIEPAPAGQVVPARQAA